MSKQEPTEVILVKKHGKYYTLFAICFSVWLIYMAYAILTSK